METALYVGQALFCLYIILYREEEPIMRIIEALIRLWERIMVSYAHMKVYHPYCYVLIRCFVKALVFVLTVMATVVITVWLEHILTV